MNYFHVDRIPYEYLSIAELSVLCFNATAELVNRCITQENVVMASNPFTPLIRMLEQRIARQELSLSESKLQLEAAVVAHAEHQDGDKVDVQSDFIKGAKVSMPVVPKRAPGST